MEKQKSEASVLAAAGTLAGSIPVMGKLLALPSFNQEMNDDPIVFLEVIDFVCDIAAGALTCAASFK